MSSRETSDEDLCLIEWFLLSPFREALKIVEDSIAFADKILDINTEGVEPLYTVLEDW